MSFATLNEQSLNQDGLNYVKVNIGNATATVVFNMFDRNPSLRFDPIKSTFDLSADLSKRVLLSPQPVSIVFTPTGRTVAISNGYFASSVMTASYDATADLYKRQQVNGTTSLTFSQSGALYNKQQLSASTSVSFNVVSTGRLMALVSGSIESTYTVTGSPITRHRLSGSSSIVFSQTAISTAYVRNPSSGSANISFNQTAELSICKRSPTQTSRIDFTLTPTANVDYRGMRTGIIGLNFDVQSAMLTRRTFFGSQSISSFLDAQASLSANIFAIDPQTMSRPFTDREMSV